jgi:hypothetical protein
VWTSPDGQEILRFHYESRVISKMTSDELFAEGLAGILPFIPFTKDGRRREVIEKIIAQLLINDDIITRELLALTQLFASLAFDKDDIENQTWIMRRFAMHQDIFSDTPAYQYIVEVGREQEREKAQEEARAQVRKAQEEARAQVQKAQKEAQQALKQAQEQAQQAQQAQEQALKQAQRRQLRALRSHLFTFIQARFPHLVLVAKEQLALIKDPATLEDLFLKVALAQTSEEVETYLSTWSEPADA